MPRATNLQMMQAIPLDDVHPRPLPYALLASYGAGFDATMSEINRSGLNAQKDRALNRERRDAWQTLRSAEKRLVIDLFFLHTDPAVFGESDSDAPPLKRPAPDVPEVDRPTTEAVARAMGNLPQLDEPDMPPTGEAPAIDPDLWELLNEIWTADEQAPSPLPHPTSFLEQET
ncbi:MAG: hypothetical protein H8E66_34890 [Planctomycetes bacterium]|nr:hypothetical protein [Planctomycetota bacterium]